MSDPLQSLKERGFFKQCSNEKLLKARLSEGQVTFYLGLDPTLHSLHVGHLYSLMMARLLQKSGCRPLVLLGGGTAQVGDPSGRRDERKVLSLDAIKKNLKGIEDQVKKIVNLKEKEGLLLDNSLWLADLNHLDFLRTIGKHFSVSRMLSFTTYKQRLETGLSLLEFSYQVLQSYDFLVLYREHGCSLQIGGDDQWANMVAGVDLIRRVESQEVIALTCPLLTRSDGQKMGKTAQGAVFLDTTLTGVFDFFQYWRNVTDADLFVFLKAFTDLDLEECVRWSRPETINEGKKRLAFEVTALVHGTQAAEKAAKAAEAAFWKGTDQDSLPGEAIPAALLQEGIDAASLFSRTPLCKSKSEAQRLINQGGASINDQRIEEPGTLIDSSFLVNGALTLKAGKKRYWRLSVEKI